MTTYIYAIMETPSKVMSDGGLSLDLPKLGHFLDHDKALEALTLLRDYEMEKLSEIFGAEWRKMARNYQIHKLTVEDDAETFVARYIAESEESAEAAKKKDADLADHPFAGGSDLFEIDFSEELGEDLEDMEGLSDVEKDYLANPEALDAVDNALKNAESAKPRSRKSAETDE